MFDAGSGQNIQAKSAASDGNSIKFQTKPNRERTKTEKKNEQSRDIYSVKWLYEKI
jgi:hypothetical protein